MKVLAAPAAYLFGDDTLGSEGYKSYMIANQLANRFNVDIIALAMHARFASSPCPSLRVVQQRKDMDMRAEQPAMWPRLSFIRWYTITARRIIQTEKIDIVHHISPMIFYGSSSFNPLAALGLARGVPFVMGPVVAPALSTMKPDRTYGLTEYSITQELDIRTLFVASKFISKLRLFRKTVDRCATIVAASSHAKTVFSSIADSDRIVVIPVGVDDEFFLPARSKLRPNPERLKILCVGALIKRKGFDLLIRAIYQASKHLGPLDLEIIGSGPERTMLMELVGRLGLGNHVSFRGYVPLRELVSHYQRCDMVCHPSYTYDIVPIEAMACGKPVIASDVDGHRDAIENWQSGVLVPPGDLTALFDAIVRLGSDEPLRERLGKRARERVEAMFAWREIVKKYYAVYDDLV